MTSNATMRWRAMHQLDLLDVNAIAASVHPDYPESPEVFAERLVLSPSTCWVVVDADDQLHGYAIAHPAVLGRPPALDTLLQTIAAQADCLYLHDVALTESTRGAGLGTALLGLLQQQAHFQNLAYLALIAVNHSQPYWRQRGFGDYPHIDHLLAEKMASYDEQAAYLMLAVPQGN